MPELPEVETVRRMIEPQIVGLKICGVDVCNRQIVEHPSAETFVEVLLGRRVEKVERRGKFLRFLLDNGDRMLLHLRMTGQVIVTPNEDPLDKHTHLLIHLENNTQLRYIDVRRFGRFWYIDKEEKEDIAGIIKLGPEPFSSEFSAEYLEQKIGVKKKAIKEMLLDQSVVAGIGNIYSDEILYRAGIHPETKCISLVKKDWKKIAKLIPEVLDWAIEKNEITPEEYLAGKGKEYRNTPYLQVYGHAGETCKVCGGTFEKTTISGRSSCFCPNCQVLR